ncbi:stage VI sporulation protein F [Evansella cellulosilytica]|uniref:Stage VI sporulation protein F n=1 Tax=Evansella cellulosilytica (strain ATCC 21833 / DSM 2522 / FERM P-1141 / JCM 9156 / N-4) TaxID=649639 RepID=E6TZE6_EVAC2|nr:stage VI sporulation protein F [Evansella cellulosilytica]ADU30120.1 hypothetical protein Bcell_1858 [Evansella cellulosilytica DSM 2522]
MDEKKNPLFDQLQEKTNVNQQDLFNLANSVSNTDLSKEENIRQLIHQVSQLANVPVSKEKEDELVKAISNKDVPMDFASLAKLFQQKK